MVGGSRGGGCLKTSFARDPEPVVSERGAEEYLEPEGTPEAFRALQRTVEELEGRLAGEREYLRTVGQELRNPVSPLVAQLRWLIGQVAERDGASVDREWILGRLRIFDRRLDKFLDTLTRVLEVPALEAGGVTLALEPSDFAQVVRVVLDRMKAEFECARCRIEAELPEHVIGIWDALRLDQIATNLLSNAARYGAGRPIEVVLESDDREARLRIRDQGIGIALEDHSMVFERHHRLARPRLEGGFGVGLWMTRELVNALHGRIELSSAPGQGAAFTVALPKEWVADGES